MEVYALSQTSFNWICRLLWYGEMKSVKERGVKVGNLRVGRCPSVPGDATVYSVVRAAARNVCRGKVNEGC